MKGLNAKQTELVLSTQGLTVTQKLAVLSQSELLGSTGKLTTAELEAILVTKKRNKEQAEALLINSGLITSETVEATSTNVVTAAKLKELVRTKALTQAEADLIATKAGITLANQKESASLLSGLGTSMKGAGTALKGLGTGILTIAQAHPVIAGITAALALCGGAALINKIKQENSANAIKKAYTEAKNTIEEINNTYSTNTSQTKAIAKEYAELAQGVDLLTNSNKTLSTEKYDRFLELSTQLSKLYPSLTKDFDNNSVAILNLSGDVDTIVGSLDNLIERQRILANQEIVKQMPDLFTGYSNNVSEYKKQLEDKKKVKDNIQRAYNVLNSWDGSTVWWFNGGQVVQGADKAVRTISDYTNALDTLGIEYKQLNVDLNNDPYLNVDGYEIDANYNPYSTELSNIYVDKFNKAVDDVKYAEQQLETEKSSINQHLNTWLQTEFFYNQIEDLELQKAIQETLFNFDWSKLPEGIDKDDWDAVSEYLRRNILFSINNISDEDVAKALSDIYSGGLNSGELLDAISKVQDYFGDEHPISVSLQTKVNDTEPLINNVKEKLQDEFDDQVGELTLDELHIAAEQIEVSEDDLLSWDELIAKIEEFQKLSDDSSTVSLSISDTIDQLNTRLKPSFDSLKSVYQDIFTDDGFALNSIDIFSTWDSIKSKLDELNKINGITVDYTAFEDFVKVLSNSESTEESVKQAFNSLADSIIGAGISGTEDFKTLKTALEDLGVVNSEIVAFDALISNTEALKEAGIDLASVTNEQLLEFANESVAAENAAQAYDMLRFHKELCSMQEMNTSNEVANLRTLAENAGYTGSIIQYLTELEQIYQELASGTTNPIVIGVKLARAAQLQALIQNAAGNINYKPEVDFHGVKESASSAAQSFTDLLDKELTVLDKKMEAGYIDFKDYIQARLALIEDYYSQGKIKSDEYYSYLENHYKQELSYRDKVVKAVTRRIDKEIDSLEKQKDAIKENYQLQIDALENQKTLLEDANKERQRQIDLQKALYELERAKNQRTKLVYSEGGGMHYVADDTAIRDAEKEAEDARQEIQISEIEKSISELEQARDAETDAIDDMIDKLQEYKEAWNDITSAYEESQEDLLAAQFFGQDWEKDILDARLDKLNQFKDDYIKIQQAMVDAAYQAAQAIENKEKVKIGDSSSDGGGDPEYKYEVVDESNPTSSKDSRTFNTKQEADAYARKMNKNTAASNGIDVSDDNGDDPKWMREFGNSNIPGYYVKKYHTGLKQGLVDKHSFDDDFRLFQKAGLGEKEVPAILREGEAVATPAQISNIADGLRTADSIPPAQAVRPYWDIEREKMEQCAAMLGRSVEEMMFPTGLISYGTAFHGMEKMTSMDRLTSPLINAINNNKNAQPVVNQYNTLNCPNVTNNSGVEYLQRELGHLSLLAMQEAMTRH